MRQVERILFLSASGVLNPLIAGSVSETDLAQALYFVSSAEVRMSKYRLLRFVRQTPPPSNVLNYCTLFLESFRSAESEGRGARADIEHWSGLNNLLRSHEYSALKPDDEQYPPGRYALPLVQRAAEKQGLPLRVLWC